MRAFYVRPSDNGDYAIEEALATLARPPEELDLALFRGLRVPLEALNFDPAERGFANLNWYDLVILAGLDPVVLAPSEALALVAFVERGGALMLLGGTHSFSNAEGTYLPLAPLLPVEVRRCLDAEVNAPPHATSHAIARGLPEPLGYISKVHAVEPKPGAQVAMTAGDSPLVVGGEYGEGRGVVVASYPECEESEFGWFFTGDAFDDFFRGAVAWMMKENPGAWVEGFSLSSRQPPPGSEVFGKLLLGCAEPCEVQLVTRLVRRQGETVQEHAASVHIEKRHEAVFSFRIPEDPAAAGLHYAVAVVRAADGRELARRDVAVEILNPTRVSAEFEYGRRGFVAGETARLQLHVSREKSGGSAEVSLDVALLDESGETVHAEPQRVVPWAEGSSLTVEVELRVPELRPGAYRLRAELRASTGPARPEPAEGRVEGKLADATEEELFVLPRPGRGERFPLIAEGGYHLDRLTTERAIRQLAGAGVNTLSLPGPAVRFWGQRAHGEAMLGYAAEQAARLGLAIAHHRRGLVPGQSPSAPLGRCALTPEFREALVEHARPILVASGRVPSLLFHELAAQAAATPEQLCRCPACQAAYQRTAGSPMPPVEARELPPAERRALAQFAASYWSRVYLAARKVRDKASQTVRLSLPVCSASFLREGAWSPLGDALAWARAADVIEVAGERDEATFRLSLSGHRALCSALDKPFGALVDLAHPSLPPAEAAFMALAHGAAHLRVAENPRFLFWTRQPTVEGGVGRVFRRLRSAGPLLACSRRPAARVALLFPHTQALERGSGELIAAHELLGSAFGDADLLHERLATGEGLRPYAAVALLGVELLPKRVAGALVEYVERGGLLLTDRASMVHEDGTAVEWPAGFFGEAETPVFEALARRRRAFGAGRTVLFSGDLAAAYHSAAGREDGVAAGALRRAIGDALAEHGVRPRARADHAAVEVGLRTCGATALLVAVNHSDERVATRIELDPEAVPAACAFDLMAGAAAPLEAAKRPALAAELAPRDGGIWALYPEPPFSLRVELAQEAFRRGEPLRYRVVVIGEAGQPARGSHILRIAVTDPSGAERPDLGGERATTDGLLEAAEPLALNDKTGTWALAVTELLTRRHVRRPFEVDGP